jgi:hypothetical protein
VARSGPGQVAETDSGRAAVARLDELRFSTAEHRVDADLRTGPPAALVAELEGLVIANPMREPLAAGLMRALHAAGRRGAALEVYDQTRKRLVDQLGAEPSAELAALHLDLLRDETPAEPAPSHVGQNHANTNLRTETAPWPPSGRTSAARIRTVVVLPAPLRVLCRLTRGNRELGRIGRVRPPGTGGIAGSVSAAGSRGWSCLTRPPRTWDSESEVAIQRALATALAGRTSLVIAHRLSMVRAAGHILLAASGGYAGLHRTQFAPQAALRSFPEERSWP